MLLLIENAFCVDRPVHVAAAVRDVGGRVAAEPEKLNVGKPTLAGPRLGAVSSPIAALTSATRKWLCRSRWS